eukprot:4479998-Pyramimonas_sp.AAC.1
MTSPIYVERGLPQGDAVAPAGMCACLVPWQPSGGMAYMGDRSLTNATSAIVDEELSFTTKFDQDV